MATLKVIKE